MTLTLAIETSAAVGSIAVCRNGDCIEERTLELGRQHGQTLVPELRKLLADHGCRPRDCDLIAVSVGPGSFTGLRVGVVCAKTLAYATGCKVAAVDSMSAIACNAPPGTACLHIVLDAQREDLFLGEFLRNDSGRWESSQGIRIVNAASYASSVPIGATLCGAGIEKIAHLLDASVVRLSADLWRPRAAWIGRLGEIQAAGGELADAWSLEPLYLRKSAAEEKWEQRQVRVE